MTSATAAQLPPITCPSSLIASCPPLLGFHPEDSLVCLLHGPGSTSPVVARVDLVPEDQIGDCAADLADRLARIARSHVTLVLWVDVPGGTRRDELPGLALIEHLHQYLGQRDATVDLAVATNGLVWWPLLCPTPTCCSAEARPLDAEIVGRVQVQYAVAGYAPLPARADVEKRLTSDPVAVARTQRYLAQAGHRSRSLTLRRGQVNGLWRILRPFSPASGSAAGPCDHEANLEPQLRARAIWPTTQTLTGNPADPITSAESALLALSDVGVRDALLVRFAHEQGSCRSCWSHSIAALVEMVRAGPAGHVAPSATVLALVAWVSGDGALGSVALERALADEPDYRLARLVGQLICSGVAPQAWRDSLAGLTEEECLHKSRPVASGAPR